MNKQYEHLFNCWCMPHDTLKLPEFLDEDPVRAYGLYAFEEGFKLALHLTAPLLTEDDFQPYQ